MKNIRGIKWAENDKEKHDYYKTELKKLKGCSCRKRLCYKALCRMAQNNLIESVNAYIRVTCYHTLFTRKVK